jgi:hypothetical protein
VPGFAAAYRQSRLTHPGVEHEFLAAVNLGRSTMAVFSCRLMAVWVSTEVRRIRQTKSHAQDCQLARNAARVGYVSMHRFLPGVRRLTTADLTVRPVAPLSPTRPGRARDAQARALVRGCQALCGFDERAGRPSCSGIFDMRPPRLFTRSSLVLVTFWQARAYRGEIPSSSMRISLEGVAISESA